jgi:hypothetical protein
LPSAILAPNQTGGIYRWIPIKRGASINGLMPFNIVRMSAASHSDAASMPVPTVSECEANDRGHDIDGQIVSDST